MKSIGYASIVLALGLGGCGYKTIEYHDAPPQFSTPVEEHTVMISPQFNLRQQGMIVEGLLQWEKASSGYLRFNPVIQQADTLDHPGDIRVLPFTKSECAERYHSPCWGLTYRTKDEVGTSASVYLSLDVENDSEFQWMVEHEIGHAMNLQHDQPGNIMYPGYEGETNIISCEDMKQFFERRNVRGWVCDIRN